MNSGPWRRQQACQLLGHGQVQPAVEVDGRVQAERPHRPQPLDRRLQRRRAVEPPDVLGGVHLDGREALVLAGLSVAGSQWLTDLGAWLPPYVPTYLPR